MTQVLSPEAIREHLLRHLIVPDFDEENHAYTYNRMPVPSVTGMLKDLGFIDATWFTEEARDRGRMVHLAAQYLLEGDLVLPEEQDDLYGIRPRMAALQRFVDDYQAVPLLLEQPAVDPIWRYAGTWDALFWIPKGGYLLLPDFKSGRPLKATRYQLALYARLVETGLALLKDRPQLRRAALELKPNGLYSLTPYTDHRDPQKALAIATTYHCRMEMN